MFTLFEADISIWGVLLAAVANMVVGTIWYSEFAFGKQWKKLVGRKDEEFTMEPMDMVTSIVIALVAAVGLNLILSWGIQVTDLSKWAAAVLVSIMVTVFFTGTSTYNQVLWEGKRKKLYALNMANFIVTYLAMTLAIAIFL